jgi:hypothetical protein
MARATRKASIVAFTCPRKADQSCSLIFIPRYEVFMSRPV